MFFNVFSFCLLGYAEFFLLFIITYTFTNYTKLKKKKIYVKLFIHKN